MKIFITEYEQKGVKYSGVNIYAESEEKAEQIAPRILDLIEEEQDRQGTPKKKAIRIKVIIEMGAAEVHQQPRHGKREREENNHRREREEHGQMGNRAA